MSQQPFASGGRTNREFHDPHEVLDFIERIREQNRRAVERYEQYVERVGSLTGEGFSSDGSVRAEVDENGVVAKVDIADAALRRGSHLGSMILDAIGEAQAARALKMAELGESLGTGRTLEMVRESIPAEVRDAIDRRRDERW